MKKHLKRSVILVLLLLLLLPSALPISACAATVEELDTLIAQCKQNKATAHEMAICARQLGYPESSVIIREASARWWQEHQKQLDYARQLEELKKPKYTAEELDLLSRIIYAEAGSSYIPDWVQQMVGSVVLNRVASSRYPNTIRDVIYQPGQYSPTWSGSIYNTPDERTVANARYLLENGSVAPANVLYQAGFRQGSGVYQTYTTPSGYTEYFCYS